MTILTTAGMMAIFIVAILLFVWVEDSCVNLTSHIIVRIVFIVCVSILCGIYF